MPGEATTARYGDQAESVDPEPSGRAALPPGAMVGEYRVERLIGRGTFGDVYSAEQPLIGKKVALKVLREDFAAEPQLVARFVAEARAVNLIKNRHIVDIFSFGTVGERGHYFVMELLEGRTLADLIDREGRVPLPRALPVFRGIADALDAAHRAGVTHRDLKPENVFLVRESDGSYTPKLLDFGVAKLCVDDVGIKTATGVALGTPRYMSPEQCRGKAVDHRTDIYALGAVIHEVLTGKPPFDAETATELMIKQTVDPPPSMSSVCAEVPQELDAPVLAMLAKRPAGRPASAGEAVAALAARARARAPMAETLPLGSVRTPPAGDLPFASQIPAPSTVRLPSAPAREAGTTAVEVPRPKPAERPAPAPVAQPMTAGAASIQIPMTRSATGYWIAGIAVVAAIGAAAFFVLRAPAQAAAAAPTVTTASASSPVDTTDVPATPPAPGPQAPSPEPAATAASAAPAARAAPAAAAKAPALSAGTAKRKEGKRDIGF